MRARPHLLTQTLLWLIFARISGGVLPPPEPEVDALRKAFTIQPSIQTKTELLLGVMEDREQAEASRIEAIRLLLPLAKKEHLAKILEVATRQHDAPDVTCSAMRAAWQLSLQDMDTVTKIVSLREAVRGEYTGDLPLNEVTRDWAGEELCNLGVVEAFKEVRDFIISSGDGEPIESVRFCKERIDAISSTETLEAAYIKAMIQAGPETSRWLGIWAFEHLENNESKAVEEAFFKVALSETEQNQDYLYTRIYRELERRGWKREQLRERGLTQLPAIY